MAHAFTTQRRQYADQGFYQGRVAGTVGAEQTHAVTRLQPETELMQYHRIAAGHTVTGIGQFFVWVFMAGAGAIRSEEHTSELQSLMRISYAVFCLKKKKTK